MVSGGCLEGVWRMSEGWMGVCSEWLWVSSQSFGHKYAWSNPKTRIEGMCFFLCPFSKSALRAQKGIKIQKVMLLWPAFFLTKTWWSFRQSDLFLCIGLGLGGHESNFWPCVLCPPPSKKGFQFFWLRYSPRKFSAANVFATTSYFLMPSILPSGHTLWKSG